MENVKNDAICHATRQNQYNPAGGGATKIASSNIFGEGKSNKYVTNFIKFY